MSHAQRRFLVFLGFLLVFPFFLKRRLRVEQRITIFAPPAVIFALLDDLKNWPLWSPWERQGDALDYTYGEIVKGAGAKQFWSARRTSGALHVVRSDASRRLEYNLKMGPSRKTRGGECKLRGRFELARDGACTRVIWRCVWERAQNPYKRYADLFYKWMIGRDFSQGLANLKALSENEFRKQEQSAAAASSSNVP